MLVALLVARPGQLLFIEQPELHLHPRAHVALARELVACADRGVKVVCETHGSLFLLAIQTVIAQGELKPDDVNGDLAGAVAQSFGMPATPDTDWFYLIAECDLDGRPENSLYFASNLFAGVAERNSGR